MPATALADDDDAAAAAAAAAVISNRLLATMVVFFLPFLGLLLPVPPVLEVVNLVLLPVFFEVDSTALRFLLNFFFGNITISLSLLSDRVAFLLCPLAFREAGGDRLETLVFVSLSANLERFRRLDNGVRDLRRPPSFLGPRLDSGEFILLDLELGVTLFLSNGAAVGEEDSEGEVSEEDVEERCGRPRFLLLPRLLLSLLPMLSRLVERRRFRSLLLRSIMYRTSYRGKSNLRPSPDLKIARNVCFSLAHQH